MPEDDALSSEVERARCTYDRFEAEGRWETMWAPFGEVEAEYRSQQALGFARLMRVGAGRLDLNGLKILDVGCGRGRLLRSFVDMGASPADLAGIDIHAPSIALAKALSPHLRFDTFDGKGVPYPSASFDLVTQFVVFSSIALPELRLQLASEMVRVLCPGGYVFWWDMTNVSAHADATRPGLDVRLLFEGLPTRQLRVGQRPGLGEVSRLPRRGRRLLRSLLDSIPVVNYPATHIAALIGPKR